MSSMIEVKTSELEGKALDWAVGIAQGWVLRETYSMMSPEDGWGRRAPGPDFQVRDPWKSWHNSDGSLVKVNGYWKLKECDWNPSTDWSQGGPLIEKYRVGIYCDYSPAEVITANVTGSAAVCTGDTFLVAACRAIVAAKLGDTVSVPSELLTHA